jgi:K+-transporting ATPase KdpF subunit
MRCYAWSSARRNGRSEMGILFLLVVVLLTFAYLLYALLRPEKF